MPYDALLRPATTLVGAGAAVNSTLLGGAAGALSTAMDVGAGTEMESHLRVGGTVTGSTPGLTVKYQESTDGSTSWTDVAGGAHAAVAATMQDPTGGAASADPKRITFQTSKRFLRGYATLANADNVFGGVTIGLQPTAGSRPTSGRS